MAHWHRGTTRQLLKVMKFEPAKSAPGPEFDWLPMISLETIQFAILLGVAAFLGIGMYFGIVKPRGFKRRASPPLGSLFGQGKAQTKQARSTQQGDLKDPRNQLDAIGKVGFETSRLLNKEEARLLPLLESAARAAERGHRVMAQTSMGEILRPAQGSGSEAQRRAAFASINSKRLDFAVFDRAGTLVCAIEYQGSGHYQGTAYMRDAVKKEVLRRAGVPLIEVPEKFDRGEVESALRRILSPGAPSNHGHTAVHV